MEPSKEGTTVSAASAAGTALRGKQTRPTPAPITTTHLVADLAPQGERLQYVVVLPLVAVRQPRPLAAALQE